MSTMLNPFSRFFYVWKDRALWKTVTLVTIKGEVEGEGNLLSWQGAEQKGRRNRFNTVISSPAVKLSSLRHRNAVRRSPTSTEFMNK